ncbi:hypothetical protein SPRG_07696 [Saprolegnia parasitica CBS 223.65]|uniref:Uncharacterized protein n=1 Tax=Saprolegnia parasitica (strain CBS 223.65) TaxID=695850 RepID=A0A067C8Y7_SAPPC|nr:hypothetical protein SPRG_07696 [Saprolegnia parasitica CBS 223.65]KDO26983.1 hypothetical protein SPRG_07696 [Saprolegnia parasitica CBS 223.65]|eukprot:XP_012202364.1 hypothetical protein SPRG_07696 [Saprolegnia parasitica CBS 223.65]
MGVEGSDGGWTLGPKKTTLSVEHAVNEPILLPVKPADDPLRVDATSLVKPEIKPEIKTEQPRPDPPAEPSASAGVIVLQDGELDPLSAMMGSSVSVADPPKASSKRTLVAPSAIPVVKDERNDYLDEWIMAKDGIFQDFASETFKVKLHANDQAFVDDSTSRQFVYSEGDPQTDSSAIRKARARLEQLESKKEPEGASATVEVSKTEYVDRVKTLQTDFVAAWLDDQKVLALRIAIKCFKLLGDVSFPKLYPCMFVLVSDVLDCFGSHVYNRILAKAEETLEQPLPSNFTSNDICIEAKETCRNWFYKTACIRELLPRIYTEIALLRCYRFLCDGEYPQIVSRLSNMIRGIGDPTIGLYCRAYLALASSRVLPPSTPNPALLSSMQDYMYIMHRFSLDTVAYFPILTLHEITESEMRAMHSPAVEWLAKGIALHASGNEAEALLSQYKQYPENGMVLSHLIKTFPPTALAKHTMDIVYLIKQTTGPKVDLYRCLCTQLVHASPPDADKLTFLNEVWGTITQLSDIHAYLTCATGFMQLLVAHYSSREVVILLKDIVRHLNTAETMDAKMYQMLQAIMTTIILEARRQLYYFSTIITSSEFLTLLGMFRHTTNVALSKRLLETFLRKSKVTLNVHGPHAALVQILFSLSLRIHDALDSLSAKPELAEAASLLCNFVLALDAALTRDGEDALLQLLVDCRSAFYKLDKVKACLIRRVLALAVRAYPRIHMTSTRNFVKGCLAYCHITIPSLPDPLEKLSLMTACAKVALLCHCLPQMDAFVKASIVLMTEVPSAEAAAQEAALRDNDGPVSAAMYESLVCAAMRDLLSLLVVVPSLSAEAPLYFYHGYANALGKFAWHPKDVNGLRMHIQLLPFLSACAQETAPYKIGLGTCDVLRALTELKSQVDVQCDVALDLVNHLLACVDATQPAALERLIKILLGVQKHYDVLHGDLKVYYANTRDALVQQALTKIVRAGHLDASQQRLSALLKALDAPPSA